MEEFYNEKTRKEVCKRANDEINQRIGITEATGWRILDALYIIAEMLHEDEIHRASRTRMAMDEQNQ